uniref:ATP-binding protein n=2 Tax=Citrobacter freundii complex TaxID=1344959 RepID=UPI002017D85D|nr:ATP-binding protein [Citrobacter freundii]
MATKIGAVLSCAPEAVIVAVESLEIFETNKENLQVGRFLKIAQGNHDFTIVTIRNIKGTNTTDPEGKPTWSFLIECQAIGTLVDDKNFDRSSLLLPVPTEHAFIAESDTLDKIFSADSEHDFPLGKLSMNKDTDLMISGNRFFSKHIAIVGSTGSGKSCTVASVLQRIVGISEYKNSNKNQQNNSHVVIFDIHDEYSAAFRLQEEELFTLTRLDIDSLQLPYWLMNSEELESMFIESNENNSHNQVSQFKHAVVLNKEKHNPNVPEVTYDTPVYFSIREVYYYIENMNRE